MGGRPGEIKGSEHETARDVIRDDPRTRAIDADLGKPGADTVRGTDAKVDADTARLVAEYDDVYLDGSQASPDIQKLGVVYSGVANGGRGFFQVFGTAAEFFGFKLRGKAARNPAEVRDLAARRASAKPSVELAPSLTVNSPKADGTRTATTVVGNPFAGLKSGRSVVVSQRIGTGEIVIGETSGAVPLFEISRGAKGFAIRPLDGARSYESGLKVADNASDGTFQKISNGDRVLKPGVAEITVGGHEMILVVPSL